MDSEDKRKNHTVQENHGGHVCHKCGWTFPNPHPSAKHRRAHKKVCGKIEGSKLAKADEKHHSDSDLSDDDRKPAQLPPPQPPSESATKVSDGKKRSDSVGVEAEGAGGRSEEEVFSDAVTEFGDVDLSRTAEKVVDLDACGVDINAEERKDLTPTAGEVAGLDSHQLDVNLEETKHTSQRAEKVVGLDAHGRETNVKEIKDPSKTVEEVAGLEAHGLEINLEGTNHLSQTTEKVGGLDAHGTEMNEEEIKDSSKTAGAAVGLDVCGADRNVKEMDSSHDLDTDVEMNVEKNKESSWAAEVVDLDSCGLDVNVEEIKGNDDVNHMLENLPIVDNGAYNKNMSCYDQFQDLDALLTKPDSTPRTSHSTPATLESVLDNRTHVPLEQTKDASFSSFSSPRASLVDSSADDSIEDRDNYAAEKMDYTTTSVGLGVGAKHSEKCNISEKDAEVKQEIDEGDKVPVMKMLQNDVAIDSSGVGFQSDLNDTVMISTVNISSKNVIADSREPDPKICHVHDEQTGGSEGLKPLEESPHSIQSEPMESYADSGASVGVSKATEASLPTKHGADVAPSSMQVQEDILLMDGSASGRVHEGPTLDQSSLREECAVEKHQDIVLAFNESSAKDIGPHELTFPEDSHNAESAVIHTISSNNLFGGSNETEATNVSLQQNEQHFCLGKDDSSHEISHEVSPETSTVPMIRDNVSDSLEGAEVQRATEMPHGEFSREKDSGCDLLSGPIPQTPRSSIADSSEEAQVHQAKNNNSGCPSSERDSGLDLSHEIIQENSTVLVAGSNVAVSVEGAEVQEKSVAIGHDSSHNIMLETSMQPTDGSESAYSVDRAEVHETITIGAGGPNIACEETKTDQTKIGRTHSQEGASGEPSPSIIAAIPESVIDDSKISSLHHKDAETDKLEKNMHVAVFSHTDVTVDSKGMAVESGSAPFVEAADWGHSEHHDREQMMDQGIEAGENQPDVQNPAPKKIACLATGTGSCIQDSSVFENCMNEDLAARDASNSHTRSVPVEGGNAVLKGNMNASILATDASVSSISQDDSLEGHWGSISDIPTPKEASNYSLKKGSASSGMHVDNSDVFEAPSFMTLVEPSKGDKWQATSEIQSAQKPGSPSSQPGWFPSLTHVVNESQGRKKNEEIISKVVNWIPGKPHTPLRNLLVEANIESKNKLSQKTPDRASPAPQEENALQEKGAPVKTGNLEVDKVTTTKGDVEKEWSSPARLPVMKRERRKVRGWVPFVCCSSIN